MPYKNKGSSKLRDRVGTNYVHDFFSKLKEKQLAWVCKYGFGSLSKIPRCEPSSELLHELVRRVNCKDGSLTICDDKVFIEPLVGSVLGLECGNVPVPEEMAVPRRWMALKEKLKLTPTTVDTFKFMLTLEKDEDEEFFIQCFVLTIIACMFATRNHYKLNLRYLHVVVQTNAIRHYDWHKFASDRLLTACCEYMELCKTPGKTSYFMGAFPHILAVIYADLVLHSGCRTTPGFPRIGHITQKQLKFLRDECIIDDGNEELILWPIMPISQSVYSVKTSEYIASIEPEENGYVIENLEPISSSYNPEKKAVLKYYLDRDKAYIEEECEEERKKMRRAIEAEDGGGNQKKTSRMQCSDGRQEEDEKSGSKIQISWEAHP